MKTSIIIVVIFGLLAAGCGPTTISLKENNREQIEDKLNYDEQDENVGAEVTLLLNDGTEVYGELLSVRDSTMAICSKYAATEKELARLAYPINTVRNNEIKELTIEGSNYVWTGLGIGIAAGTGIGVIIGNINEEPSRNGEIRKFWSGVIGFLIGAITGPIVGYSHSTEEFIFQEIPPDYDFSFLKPLARYPAEEPEYLKAIP